MKPIIDDINKIILNIVGKKDPLLAEIMMNWTKIVGGDFSQKSSPFKISTYREKGIKINVLYIKTDNAALSLEISFQQELIIERIAVYLGFKAIHKLRLII
ncbi:DUF721 domain-containing protein [Candidatus Trichorickettsia mobilis]|uniref:DUF721 domain-containing protein n=1 Tax=Candidatus Trichorickettsia mobilis TaxID=1346319 RepID=A0ABZ0UXG7_9RICK|nr:DUF721 domain-containing protein [Candidatus Trichorickettsia mobilis]WPY00764.1 DUF721 domain-containing protein [Candidatus Trichorickettsia mobilis]